MGCATEWSETLTVELSPFDADSTTLAVGSVSRWEDEDPGFWEEEDERSMKGNPPRREADDEDDDWDEDDDEDWDWDEDDDE
jgi:hypothetical protein